MHVGGLRLGTPMHAWYPVFRHGETNPQCGAMLAKCHEVLGTTPEGDKAADDAAVAAAAAPAAEAAAPVPAAASESTLTLKSLHMKRCSRDRLGTPLIGVRQCCMLGTFHRATLHDLQCGARDGR